MKAYLKEDLIPGTSAGGFLLGLRQDVVIEHLKDMEFSVKKNEEYKFIEINLLGIQFILNKSKEIFILNFIRVTFPYEGKFLGKYGIGTMMNELKGIDKYDFNEYSLSKYHEYEFILPNYQGISFVTDKPWDDNTEIKYIEIHDMQLQGAGYFD